MRPERSTDTVLAIGGEAAVASHDGKRIAFWKTGPQGNNPQELRIAEIPGGAERLLTSLPAGHAGGALAWANDDTGLLYEEHDPTPSGPVPGAGPKLSMLMSFDLTATQAPGETASSLMLTNGLVFIPLAWDRAGRMSTALTTGEGGYAVDYITWDRNVQPGNQNPVKFTKFPWLLLYVTVHASPDARMSLAIDQTANVLRVWPAADISKAADVSPGTPRVTGAKWRPGAARDVAWVLDNTVVGTFTYQTSNSGTIYRAQNSVRIMTWRVDGSGLVLNEGGRGTFVVEIATGQMTALTGFGDFIAGAVFVR